VAALVAGLALSGFLQLSCFKQFEQGVMLVAQAYCPDQQLMIGS
jgi:hypothetical protein